MEILLEDNHLLAVSKPPGLATMGAAPGKPTVLDEAKAYIKRKYRKPGEVYLGVVSRLDAPVTGVLLFARTSKAASRLTAAFRDRRVEKTYIAMVEGAPRDEAGVLVHHLRKDDERRRMYATAANAAGAQRAELRYRFAATGSGLSLVVVRPVTGRKHQIRVQLSKNGTPILGDRKYGAAESFPDGIALHSWRLRLEHPVRREPIEVVAGPPAEFVRRRPRVESELDAAYTALADSCDRLH